MVSFGRKCQFCASTTFAINIYFIAVDKREAKFVLYYFCLKCFYGNKPPTEAVQIILDTLRGKGVRQSVTWTFLNSVLNASGSLRARLGFKRHFLTNLFKVVIFEKNVTLGHKSVKKVSHILWMAQYGTLYHGWLFVWYCLLVSVDIINTNILKWKKRKKSLGKFYRHNDIKCNVLMLSLKLTGFI